MKTCVFLADGFETVEALAVVDILRRADVDTAMVSVTEGLEVTSAQGIRLMADMVFDEDSCMQADAVFLPGGMPGTRNLEEHEGVIRIVKNFYNNGKLIAAICAAPSILGHLGMLEGRRATSHAGFVDQLVGAEVVDEPVVISGKIITGRGMGTAVPLGLALARELKGADCADQIMKAIHFAG